MKNKKVAVIFDLDGVIVDSAKFHYLAWKKIAKDLNIDFKPEDNELLKGVSRTKSLEILLKLGNKTLSEQEKQKLLDAKNQHYLSLIETMKKGDLLPGIQKIISFLKQNNIPFALGSASKNAKKILNILGITDDFSAIVDGKDVSKAKPNPEVFLTAAQKMNVKPENCIVIEDAQAGIDAAKNAQMTAIGIGEKLKNTDYKLSETNQLTPELLKKIIEKIIENEK